MLKELFELVQGTAKESVIENPDIPDEQNQEVVSEATNTVASGLRNMVAGGGISSILDMFKGGKDNNSLMSNPIVSMMIGHFAGKLMSKYNMNGSKASGLAAGLIPSVLGNLISRSNDSNDNGFSLDNLLSSITGGKSREVVQERGGGSITDILSQLGGGNSSGNGGGGLMDIIGQLAGGAQQQQQRNGGSLLDLIKGFAR